MKRRTKTIQTGLKIDVMPVSDQGVTEEEYRAKVADIQKQRKVQETPDKVADQISDAILDACLEQDINSKVACECMIGKSAVFLGGEITTLATLNYREIIQNVLSEIGYDDPALGFDFHDFDLALSINS